MLTRFYFYWVFPDGFLFKLVFCIFLFDPMFLEYLKNLGGSSKNIFAKILPNCIFEKPNNHSTNAQQTRLSCFPTPKGQTLLERHKCTQLRQGRRTVWKRRAGTHICQNRVTIPQQRKTPPFSHPQYCPFTPAQKVHTYLDAWSRQILCFIQVVLHFHPISRCSW